MQSRVNAYLHFKDNAREAMQFYQTVFGGKLTMSTFGEFQPDLAQDATEANKIMHAMLEADNGISFMGADTPRSMHYDPGSRISMALSGDHMDELRGYFDQLSVGGQIVMPLAVAPWGDAFGLVTDRFGVDWMVNVAGQKQA